MLVKTPPLSNQMLHALEEKNPFRYASKPPEVKAKTSDKSPPNSNTAVIGHNSKYARARTDRDRKWFDNTDKNKQRIWASHLFPTHDPLILTRNQQAFSPVMSVPGSPTKTAQTSSTLSTSAQGDASLYQ